MARSSNTSCFCRPQPVSRIATRGSGNVSGCPPPPSWTLPETDVSTGPVEATDVDGSRWVELLDQVPEFSDSSVDELLRQVIVAKETGDEG